MSHEPDVDRQESLELLQHTARFRRAADLSRVPAQPQSPGKAGCAPALVTVDMLCLACKLVATE